MRALRVIAITATLFSSTPYAMTAGMDGVAERDNESRASCPITDDSCERAMNKAIEKQNKKGSGDGSAWNLLWIAGVGYLIYRKL